VEPGNTGLTPWEGMADEGKVHFVDKGLWNLDESDLPAERLSGGLGRINLSETTERQRLPN